MPEWVKCKDRLPEDAQDVLLGRAGSSEIFMGYIRGNRWWYRDGAELETIQVEWNSEFAGLVEYFTHWMPLPEPPKP